MASTVHGVVMCVVGGGNKELRFAPNDVSKKGTSGLHIPLGHKELDLWIFICPVLNNTQHYSAPGTRHQLNFMGLKQTN